MSSGGGNTTTTRTEPYAPAEPFLQDILGEAQNIYRSGVGRQFFPGSTVVPFADQTQQALNLQQAAALEAAAPSALNQQAANVFSQFASTPQTNQYLSDIRSGITSDVLGNIQTQFGGMGRTGTSPGAQQAAARGVAQAYAPIAAQISNQERNRQLQAAGALPGIQAGMDARRMGAISSLGQVGSAYEDLARRQLQDQISRFQFGQQAPMQALQDYAGLITPIASGFPVSQAQGPDRNPLLGGLGGALGGAQIANLLGSTNPLFAIGGGLAGLLQEIFMPHNIFHGQPFNPFGLLSDAAQDYLSGDLPAARGRPFLPGMTVNPVTGDRMTNRERIEMNRAARQGLLAPDRFGRVRPSRVDNFMGLPGARVNPNVMIPIEQRDRVPFVQDLAATLGPVAEAAQVGTNLVMKNVVDPTLQYFLGTDPAFQNVDTNYDFDNQTKAAQTETAKSFTGEGGIISDIVQDVQNKYDEQIQKLDTRKALREAERFRAAKDPTAYSISDFKNDFPEIVQQGEDAIRSGYNEFRKTYKGGNYKEAKDAVTNKLNQLKTEVEDKTSEILENTKNNKNIQNSPASDEEKATSEQQTTQANQEIIKDTLDKASKNPKLSELANNDMMLMAISLLASAEKGEGTAEGLLNAMKAVQEANQTSTESIVTLTDPKTGNQRSYRRDDPAVDEAIAAGAVVRPMSILDSLTFGALGQGMGQGMGLDIDPVLLKKVMDENPDLNAMQARQEIINRGLTL